MVIGLLHIWEWWGGSGCEIRDCRGWKVDLTMFDYDRENGLIVEINYVSQIQRKNYCIKHHQMVKSYKTLKIRGC